MAAAEVEHAHVPTADSMLRAAAALDELDVPYKARVRAEMNIAQIIEFARNQ